MWFSQLAFQSSVHIYHINRYSSCDQFKDHITFLTVTCMWSSHLVLWHSSAECTCTPSARPTCMLAFSSPSVHLYVNSQYTSRARSRDTCHVIQSATLATFQPSVHIYHINRYSSRDQFKDHIPCFSVTCMWSSHIVLWHSSAECTCTPSTSTPL